MEKRRNCSLGAISPLFYTSFYLLLDFHVKAGTRFSLPDKWLFEISEVEITRVNCIYKRRYGTLLKLLNINTWKSWLILYSQKMKLQTVLYISTVLSNFAQLHVVFYLFLIAMRFKRLVINEHGRRLDKTA